MTTPGKLIAHYEPERPLPNPRRHPLGRDPEPGTNYHTTEVRNALVEALKLYFAGCLTGETGCAHYGRPVKLTTSPPASSRFTPNPVEPDTEDDPADQERLIESGSHDAPRYRTYPGDELVSRLELGLALQRLREVKKRPYEMLLCVVKGDPYGPADERETPISQAEICRRTRHGHATVRAWIEEALDYLIDCIWRDD